MSSTDTLFYVGPVGGMLAIPAVDSNDPTVDVYEAENDSLDGSATFDRFGVKRSWTLGIEALTPRLESELIAMRTGVLAGPLYLVDPLAVNAFPSDVASAGSSPYRVSPFTTDTAGVIADVVPSDPASFPLPRRHKSVVRVANGGAATARLLTPFVPVLSESYTLSVFVKSTAVVTVELVGGTGVVAASSVSTGGGAWQRVTATGTPAGGTAVFRVAVPAGATVDVAAPQLERGALSAWSPGVGTPRVVMSKLDRTSPIYPYTTCTPTFRAV